MIIIIIIITGKITCLYDDKCDNNVQNECRASIGITIYKRKSSLEIRDNGIQCLRKPEQSM